MVVPRELDFLREARLMDAIRRRLASDPVLSRLLLVPEPLTPLCSPGCLVMQRMAGEGPLGGACAPPQRAGQGLRTSGALKGSKTGEAVRMSAAVRAATRGDWGHASPWHVRAWEAKSVYSACVGGGRHGVTRCYRQQTCTMHHTNVSCQCGPALPLKPQARH